MSVYRKDFREKNKRSVFFALEVNKKFIKIAKKKCPDVVIYHAGAKHILKYVKKNGKKDVDCIISGIPWAALNKQNQKEIMKKIYRSLSSDGVFLTFAYLQGLILPSGMKFKKLLDNTFSSVEKSKIVWKNLPPAFIYICKK